MVKYSLEALDSIFSALSDPVRRAVLERLIQGEATVTELAEPFVDRISLPAVSKHLKVLEQAGLIVRRKEGREHYLRLSPTPLQDAAGWLKRYQHFWEYQIASLDQYLSETATVSEDKTGEQSNLE